MDIVSEEQETLLFEVLTDIGQTTENSIWYSGRNQEAVMCQVQTDLGKTLEHSSGFSDTESTDG